MLLVPENVREVLVDRYEYIVAEKEVIPDLTDDMRTCETCTKWASAYVRRSLEYTERLTNTFHRFPSLYLHTRTDLSLSPATSVTSTFTCNVFRHL